MKKTIAPLKTLLLEVWKDIKLGILGGRSGRHSQHGWRCQDSKAIPLVFRIDGRPGHHPLSHARRGRDDGVVAAAVDVVGDNDDEYDDDDHHMWSTAISLPNPARGLKSYIPHAFRTRDRPCLTTLFSALMSWSFKYTTSLVV